MDLNACVLDETGSRSVDLSMCSLDGTGSKSVILHTDLDEFLLHQAIIVYITN